MQWVIHHSVGARLNQGELPAGWLSASVCVLTTCPLGMDDAGRVPNVHRPRRRLRAAYVRTVCPLRSGHALAARPTCQPLLRRAEGVPMLRWPRCCLPIGRALAACCPAIHRVSADHPLATLLTVC